MFSATEAPSRVIGRNVVVITTYVFIILEFPLESVTPTISFPPQIKHKYESSQDDITLCPHNIFSTPHPPSFYVTHMIDGTAHKDWANFHHTITSFK